MSEFGRRRSQAGLDGLKPAFERLTDGVSTLVKQHIELARHEITLDATTAAKRISVLVVCGVVALVGYLMLMAGLLLLAGWLGGLLAAWIVALVLAAAHLGAAGLFGARYARKLRQEKPVSLAQISDELQKDKQWLQQIAATTQKDPSPAPLLQGPAGPN